ncbi:hypothetical protein B9479_005392 [Cryptococcus floricola]|uniref:RRM domain-containing protein n=1 Tax=Cryptococcus floricola TaxID=2591691 RepID=A0A5D3AVZ0_9TREE|nr:hypothetical protein B9479_005392 [Cryptococcus floricola]
MSGQAADGYTEEQRAAAWAAYYAQQGYTEPAAAAAPSSSYASYSTGPYPASASTSYGASYDADMLQQSSAYTPQGAAEAKHRAPGKRETVIRKGNGKVWEDHSLIDWDPKWFRLFVGDVSNDVNERTLDEAFQKYSSYCKCKVVRDRLSEKAKYAFIAFKDPEDFLKAWKEMDGKYVGNRPIRLMKVKDDKYGSIRTVEISGKKSKQLEKIKKNHGKVGNRPAPF